MLSIREIPGVSGYEKEEAENYGFQSPALTCEACCSAGASTGAAIIASAAKIWKYLITLDYLK